MRGFLFLMALNALIPGALQGIEPEGDVERTEKLDSAVVLTSRAGRNTPVTYTMVSKEELQRSSPVNSLPMLLNMQPSVVAVNEGGTGLGYSKMTVRGAKGSQINVTLNGITLNDAESQEVFWVNIPALSNILSSVQLQRGLGTSANGAGAFGASINMSTASVGSTPHGFVDLGYGSYDTFTVTASAGTGLTKSGLYFDFLYSRGGTDGYIRNAYADVQSALAVLGWMKGRNSLRLTWLFGDQHTGITWHGISPEQYAADRRYNKAGLYHDAFGNIHYYDNDTDNYTQHHLQLNYTHEFSDDLLWTSTFNYTRGDGYYEQYKAGKEFSEYGFSDDFAHIRYDSDGAVIDSWDPASESDFITEEALANDYFVLNSDLRYHSDRLNLTAGINLSRYDGDHIGSILWNQVLGADYDYESHDWYFNNGLKQEANAIVRAEFLAAPWLTVYTDLQYRGVWLKMRGVEDDGVSLDYDKSWQFFNPRAGVAMNWKNHRAYASAAFGHREPGRSDIKELILEMNNCLAVGAETRGVDIRPEKMLDMEVGYAYTTDRLSLSGNIYLMEYRDMLIETGKLSSSGYAIKENVPRSWRRGVELAASWRAFNWADFGGNLTLSTNKIRNYTAYVEEYDNLNDWNYLGQIEEYYETTDILMSPSIVGMAYLTFRPFVSVNSVWNVAYLTIDGKYVGKQYFDNTSDDSRSIPAYFVSGLVLGCSFPMNTHSGSSLGVSVHVNNLFNNMYYADAWVWRPYFREEKQFVPEIGLYPQAPLNAMLKVSYRF